MNPRLRCHSALLTTAAAGVIVVTLALGAGPAFADTSATAATTPAATATPSTRWSSTAGAMPVDTGTEMDSLPSYGASSPTTPIVLGAVQAGAPFSYDLRPTNATGATYTLTSTDGSPATLDPTTSFVGGVLSGSATTAGTFLAQVTATTPYGTTSEWVTDTVTAGPAKSVDVEASRAWSGGSPSQMTGSGSTSIGQGGSLVLAAWTEDGFGNRSDSTARAIVTSNDPSDVIVDGSSGWVVSFPDASTHVVTVAVDSVSTSFTVAVTPTATAAPDRTGSAATPSITTGPTSSGAASTGTAVSGSAVSGSAVSGSAAATSTSTSPSATTTATVPVVAPTPAPATAHVTTAASTDPVSGSTLAFTGSETSGPLAWALGLLAAGAAVTGLRFRRRRRH